MNALHPRVSKRLTSRALMWLVAVCPGVVSAQVSAEFCGPVYIPGASGPWDYRIDKQNLPVVENAHFTATVEYLVRGKTGERVGPDLDYTLARFPNHHRALVAVSKLHDKKLPEVVTGLPRPTECYFERAVRFRANDTVVRLLYAQFLAKTGRTSEAKVQLQFTAALQPDNAITQRNVGLLYLEMKDHDMALAQAHVLAKLDPADTSLRQPLEKAGRWRDAAAGAGVTGVPSSGASAAAPASAPVSQ